MNLRTFTAATMIECLALVKREMGHNAVILHTRTYRVRIWCGLRRREMVEITAGIGMSGPERRRPVTKPAAPVAARPTPAPQVAAYLESPAAARAMRMPANQSAGLATVLAAAPSQVVERPGQQLLQSQAAKEIIGIQVAKDVEDLKKLVAGLVDTMHKKEAPQVPEELFDYYLKLVDN